MAFLLVPANAIDVRVFCHCHVIITRPAEIFISHQIKLGILICTDRRWDSTICEASCYLLT